MVSQSPEFQTEGSALVYRAPGVSSSPAAQTLTNDEAAEYIGFSSSWMRQSRMSGRVDTPPFLRVGGRSIRYLRTDLDRWLEQRRCAPGPENAHQAASASSASPGGPSCS
jgi:predicted DNA-binding transcriptional regulator AlpA